jgi:prepilin-type N-terminal cleavage/methylation domain-containing protein
MKPNTRTTTQQRGFTLTQMLVTLSIIAVVSTGGVLGIKTARAEFRLQNSARLFATYIEKARADAIRRHAATGQESLVETFGPGSTLYAITMDYGAGVVETRTFNLESGLSFATAAKKMSFDWRGRIAEAWVFQIRSEYLDRSLPVDVSGSGDITVGEQHFPDQLIPPVEIAEVTGDVDATATPTPYPTATPPQDVGGDPDATPTPTPEPTPTPTPTPNGNGNGNDGNNGNGNNQSPTPTPTPGVTPTPTPTPTPSAQCTSAISPAELNLSQSDAGNHTGSAVFTMVNATGTRTISASIAGNGNSLVLGVSLLRIDGSGSSVITVTTKNGAGNRGVFIVNVEASPACGATQQLKVSVSN